jgi:predicted nucleic acid-binding protein
MRNVTLDSWAVLAFLRGEEPATRVVAQYLRQGAAGTTRLTMNVVNLGEVFYRLMRLQGEDVAEDRVSRFRTGPVEIVVVREALAMEAARIKGVYPLAYADAFAVATARAEGATLATGDPEILALPRPVVRRRVLTRA